MVDVYKGYLSLVFCYYSLDFCVIRCNEVFKYVKWCFIVVLFVLCLDFGEDVGV